MIVKVLVRVNRTYPISRLCRQEPYLGWICANCQCDWGFTNLPDKCPRCQYFVLAFDEFEGLITNNKMIPLTSKQENYIEILCNDIGLDTRLKRNDFLSNLLARPITAVSDIAKVEASQVIEALKQYKETNEIKPYIGGSYRKYEHYDEDDIPF